MTASFFPAEAAEFLGELAAKNTREQFTANRSTYDRAIRGPLEELTAAENCIRY